MSKLGIIAPSNFVQFFKSLGVEVIESTDGDRESAVAITNAVSAAPSGAPEFPILVHGNVDFMGASAWLRAMTTTRNYTVVVIGGDPEKFATAGNAKHIALPASMQDIFAALGGQVAGLAANNRFGNIVVGEDLGITDALAAVPETQAPAVAEDLPFDLIPAPVAAEATGAPTWAQAAPLPAQQPAPVAAPVPVDTDVPAWAQQASPASAAPAPVAAPSVPAPALAQETGAADESFTSAPMPVLTAEAYEAAEEPAVESAPVPVVEAPVFTPAPAAEPALTSAAPPVGEPVYRPEQVAAPAGRALTRREAAAAAAAAQAAQAPVEAPAWATASEPTPVSAPAPVVEAPVVAAPEQTTVPFTSPGAEPAQAQAPVAARPFELPNFMENPSEPTPTVQPQKAPTVFNPFGTSPAAAAPAPVVAPVAAEPEAPSAFFNPAAPPSTAEPLPTPTVPSPDLSNSSPAYIEPPAYTAPRLAPQDDPFADKGPRAKIIASFAGKGGVTKTTTALILAKKAADARLKTVIIDMDKGQDNVAAYMRLRSASLPTVFDAAASGNPAAALITPDQFGKFRHEAAGSLDFAVVFGPGNEHASNHPSLTSDVYRQVIDYAAAHADVVVLDTQILKADRSSSRLFYDVVSPLLVQEAWGVGITDQSRAGLEDLENRLKELQKNEHLGRDRMLIMAANTSGFNQTQAESFAKRFRTYGDFIGATSADDAFKAQLNVGRIDADSPAVSATMDAILHKVTGNEAFAPKPVKKRRGLFGRG